jgi:hypothetical protein
MKALLHSHFKNTKEFVKLNKLWSKTWKSLVANPFSKLLKDVDFDENDFYNLVRHHCEHQYEDAADSDKQEIKDFVSAYNLDEQTKKLLTYSFFNYVEYINDYLDSFDIMLVNTGRDAWDTIRYMNHFMGDYNNTKVCLWHERYDNESGEFVVFNKNFVEKCLVNNSFPEIPNRTEPSKEYKDLAEMLRKQEKKRSCDVRKRAEEILKIIQGEST